MHIHVCVCGIKKGIPQLPDDRISPNLHMGPSISQYLDSHIDQCTWAWLKNMHRNWGKNLYFIGAILEYGSILPPT